MTPRRRTALERRAARGVRRAQQFAQRLDPIRFTLRPITPGTPLGLACIYRARNADTVRRMLAGCPASTTVRLWSLDDVPDELAPRTVGRGPGTRLELLNRLVERISPAARAGGLVLADDDVRFVVGEVGSLVATAADAGLDVSQPAHTGPSNMAWPFVRRRSLTLVRRTDFVEQGPVVVFSADAQQHLLPLPEDLGMGWGIEVRWWEAAVRHGLQQGIVDAVAVQHLGRVAAEYDRVSQHRQLEAELARVGLTDLRQLQRVVLPADQH